MNQERITTPESPALDQLCAALSEAAQTIDLQQAWPSDQLRECARHGVYRWFLEPNVGGMSWNEVDLIRGYLRLSGACLTTSFILTQATGALRRIAAAGSEALQSSVLPRALDGDVFCTLGISHLTTSRRHLGRPALAAEPRSGGFVLDGFSPWVTGGAHADWIVVGAQCDDGRQILAALPTDLPGVAADEPAKLVALTASRTGAVRLQNVFLESRFVLAGPVQNVMQSASGAKTGGLQTSALALGLAARAIEFIETESTNRADLAPAASGLRDDYAGLEANLLALAAGESACSAEHLRTSANSLVLRATQAALAAAKGTGYLHDHPCGRWCREALFFLVWSCPQPVMAANLCELAGLAD